MNVFVFVFVFGVCVWAHGRCAPSAVRVPLPPPTPHGVGKKGLRARETGKSPTPGRFIININPLRRAAKARPTPVRRV